MAFTLGKRSSGFVRFVVARFVAQECQKTAGSLTYTTLFALVPLMTVAYGIMSALPSTESAGSGIEDFLFNNLLPESGQVVSNYLADFARQARNLTFIGVVFLVVTAILMMKSIERAFNGIWSVAEDRKGASSFLLYWAVLTLGPLLMGSGLAVTSFVVSHELFVDATNTLGIRTVFLQLLPLFTSSLAFMMLFHLVPRTHVPLKHAWVGGLFTAVCFELAKWIFTQFVSQSPSYKVVYGAFAAVPLFLLWIYISWNLLLLGATLVMALQRYRPHWRQLHRKPFIVALQLIQTLYRRWKDAEPLMPAELQEMLSTLTIRQQKQLLQVLQEHRLLVQVKDDPPVKGRPAQYWQLGRDLSELTQWQLLSLLPWPVPAELSQMPGDGADNSTDSPKEGFALLSPSVINILQAHLQQSETTLSGPADGLFRD